MVKVKNESARRAIKDLLEMQESCRLTNEELYQRFRGLCHMLAFMTGAGSSMDLVIAQRCARFILKRSIEDTLKELGLV